MKRIVLLLFSVVVGCGESIPETAKVTGKVTLDGKPVEGAVVTFQPDGEGKPATGKTDANGQYTLMTAFQTKTVEGVVPGTYKISVSKYSVPDGGMSPYGQQSDPPAVDPNKKLTEEEEMALLQQGYTAADAQPQNRNETLKNELPAKYANPATSGLSYTVVPGENSLDLDLTSR
ncbi:MAG: hypothetical protein KatS3mg111_1846 [Pirellulaceae bacterium]|nr:MAG: hypothetical protein KatS3mg111_1846 [Pirellulaceae bacterium]